MTIDDTMDPTLQEIVGTRFSRSFRLPEANAATPCLLIRIYPVQGIEEPLELPESTLLIGRDSECELALCDDSVSRRHAQIEPVDNGHVLTDLGSTNGTFVNERQITGEHRLAAGDRVRFGNQIFKYLGGDLLEAQYYEVIFKLMTTDGLTSVHNKRYLIDTVERELEQSRRSGAPLCLMMLDLDRFKSVNDKFGHLAGDAVLVEFARRAQSVLRSGDLLARYGGEEFAMLLTHTELDDAVQIAERIRRLTADFPVEFEGHSISVTVSSGICCYRGDSECMARDLFAAADERLYAAKDGGRNQVRHACWDQAAAPEPEPVGAGI